MIPLISLAISLATKAVPWLVGKIGGENAEKTAGMVIKAVEEVAGIPITDEASFVKAAGIVEKDPSKWYAFQTSMKQLDIDMEKEETKRYQSYLDTLKTDVLSNDPVVRRWRPRFANYVSFSWLLMFITIFVSFMGTLVYQFVSNNPVVDLSTVADAMAKLLGATAQMWSVALLILGVYVKKRSDDKQTSIGAGKSGIVDGILQLFKKK